MGDRIIFDTLAGKILITFATSMVPVLELRAAIPAAVAMGLNIVPAYIVSVVGNLLPIPFIILFIRKIFEWMRGRNKKFKAIVEKLEAKAEKNKEKVLKYEFWGLVLLVAVPLPGTGAWTGALVAAMMDMQLKRAMPAIAIGVMIAGLVVSLATCGVIGFK